MRHTLSCMVFCLSSLFSWLARISCPGEHKMESFLVAHRTAAWYVCENVDRHVLLPHTRVQGASKGTTKGLSIQRSDVSIIARHHGACHGIEGCIAEVCVQPVVWLTVSGADGGTRMKNKLRHTKNQGRSRGCHFSDQNCMAEQKGSVLSN